MLALFPRMEEDELLYSALSRYGYLLGYRDGGAVLSDAFGGDIHRIRFDLPSGLATLQASIPGAALDSAVRWVTENTLFPYVTSFASTTLRNCIRRIMIASDRSLPPHIGPRSQFIPGHSHMMLCFKCLEADIRQGLPGRWFRGHQLPGVEICPKHGSALQRTTVEANRNLACLTRDIFAASTQRLIPPARRPSLEWMALESTRLLAPSWRPIDPSELRALLRDILSGYRRPREPILAHSMRVAAAVFSEPALRPLRATLKPGSTEEQMAVRIMNLLYCDSTAAHPALVLMLLKLAGACLADLQNRLPAEAPNECSEEP